MYQAYAFYSSFYCSRIGFCKKHHEHEPFGIALIQFSQWQKSHFGLTGILKCHQRIYFKKEIGLNIWLTQVLILRCSLLCWYSVSAPSGKNRFYSAEHGVRHPRVPCGSGLWYLPPRCLNIRKEILLLLPQVKMSFLLQLYKTNKRVTAHDEQKKWLVRSSQRISGVRFVAKMNSTALVANGHWINPSKPYSGRVAHTTSITNENLGKKTNKWFVNAKRVYRIKVCERTPIVTLLYRKGIWAEKIWTRFETVHRFV